MNWTLILYIYAGVLASGDSVALNHIPGFKTEQHCQAAGSAAKPLVKGSAKEIRFVCIRQE
jgi:hypothetical protein